MTLRTLLIMDLHQPFEHLVGSFCVPKEATFPPCLAVKSLPQCLPVFCRVWLYRFLRMQSEKFTCVCFGTERLTLLAHIILVLSLSYTGLTTLLCHRSLLRIRTCVVIRILRHRCTWCRLLLIAHLDAPRVGAVILVMLNVEAAEVRFQPKPSPAVCSQRTRSDDAPDREIECSLNDNHQKGQMMIMIMKTPDPWVGSGFSLLLKK